MFLHLDLDAFFISAARTLDPSLKGIPAAVISGDCDDIFGDHLPPGMVLSASYEARKLGIKCTMQASKAQKIAPQIKLVPTDFKLYKSLSKALFEILYTYTNEIEKYSIDEYFVDLKGTKYEPLNLAKSLQKRILDELDLPCSVGASPHKWWAKLATSLAKPAGVREIKSFDDMSEISICEFAGIGKKMSEILQKHGISKLGDVPPAKDIFESFGKSGSTLYEHICGLGGDKLRKKEPPKSRAIARSFAPIISRAEIKRRLKILCQHLYHELYKENLSPKKLELKFTYVGSKPSSHTLSLERELSDALLSQSIFGLFSACDSAKNAGICYLSVGAYDFYSENGVFWQQKDEKSSALDAALNKLRDKYTSKII